MSLFTKQILMLFIAIFAMGSVLAQSDAKLVKLGDDVFGFVSVNEGIKVHKKNCPNAISLQSNYAYRIISAKWIDSTQQEFMAEIKLTGIDNIGLINQITEIISDNLHVNMRNLNFDSDGGTFTGRITVVVKNNSILKKLIGILKQVNGIEKVSRS